MSKIIAETRLPSCLQMLDSNSRWLVGRGPREMRDTEPHAFHASQWKTLIMRMKALGSAMKDRPATRKRPRQAES